MVFLVWHDPGISRRQPGERPRDFINHFKVLGTVLGTHMPHLNDTYVLKFSSLATRSHSQHARHQFEDSMSEKQPSDKSPGDQVGR